MSSVAKQILTAQRDLNIPDHIMCNILNVSEREFRAILAGRLELTPYQRIMFVIETHRPWEEKVMDYFSKQIWTGIDRLAAKKGMTPSGLARTAGLDPTIFNKSKRFNPNGKSRCPNTETIWKVLEATNTDIQEFAKLTRLDNKSKK